MDKRKIGLGAGILIGLLVLFFVVKWFMPKQVSKTGQARVDTKQSDQKKTKEMALSLRQACHYADSVGIDTTRFSGSSTTD